MCATATAAAIATATAAAAATATATAAAATATATANTIPAACLLRLLAQLWVQSNGTRSFPGGQRPVVGVSGYVLGEYACLVGACLGGGGLPGGSLAGGGREWLHTR